MKTPFQYGKEAFQKNMKSVPVLDRAFLEAHLKGKEVGEGIAPLTEWKQGWLEAQKEAEKNHQSPKAWLTSGIRI